MKTVKQVDRKTGGFESLTGNSKTGGQVDREMEPMGKDRQVDRMNGVDGNS